MLDRKPPIHCGKPMIRLDKQGQPNRYLCEYCQKITTVRPKLDKRGPDKNWP